MTIDAASVKKPRSSHGIPAQYHLVMTPDFPCTRGGSSWLKSSSQQHAWAGFDSVMNSLQYPPPMNEDCVAKTITLLLPHQAIG